MNQYFVRVSAGQIKLLIQFFDNYADEHVQMELQSQSKVQAEFCVTSTLAVEETKKYLEQLFQHSKYGPGLHYLIHVSL